MWVSDGGLLVASVRGGDGDGRGNSDGQKGKGLMCGGAVVSRRRERDECARGGRRRRRCGERGGRWSAVGQLGVGSPKVVGKWGGGGCVVVVVVAETEEQRN
ncbi:hypothetical protein BVRB_4g091260 [Beta vulgaris subsp. vulgaris]|uniref:Uncharacterized protein n=1 Tax=Beta vulgaris subsp. vulgaris TaxID=3555 RepID=A0A0J8CFX9_BETVV|nr:hypothetical protein BVRB_4g091260 [Beta vulgaris subsp. vulgaris]